MEEKETEQPQSVKWWQWVIGAILMAIVFLRKFNF